MHQDFVSLKQMHLHEDIPVLPHGIHFKSADFDDAQLTPLSATNNAVFLIQNNEKRFVLKTFAQERMYLRETQMRDCLRQETQIHFPKIIETVQQENVYYTLMEFITGDSLLDVWRRTGTAPEEDLRRLGHLLADLHSVSLSRAMSFLEPETILFSEQYKDQMKQLIMHHVPGINSAIDACHARIIQAQDTLAQTVIHADFGPHQVIVADDQWVLLDFEFATLGSFADDLAGTEARLKRWDYESARFLDGYFAVHHRREAYEMVRQDFMAYNLLAIITYALSNSQTIDHEDVTRLRDLLTRSSA